MNHKRTTQHKFESKFLIDVQLFLMFLLVLSVNVTYVVVYWNI